MGCHTSAAVRSPPLASWPSAHRRCGGSSLSAEAFPGDSRGRVRGFPPGDPCRAALDADSQRFVLRETWRRFHGDMQEQQHQADACSEDPCSHPPCRVVTLHATTADGELRVVCTSMAGETLAAIDFGGWPLERQTFGHLRCHLWRQLGGSSHSDAGNSPAGGKRVDRLRLVLPCGQLVGTSYDHQLARHVLLGHDGAPVDSQRATTASTPTASLRRIAYNGAEAPEESQGFDVGADELCCKSLSATEHKEGTLIRAACEDSLGRPSGFAPLSIGATKAQSTLAVHTQRLVHSSLAAQAAASRKVAHGGGMLGPSRTSPKDAEEEDGSRLQEKFGVQMKTCGKSCWGAAGCVTSCMVRKGGYPSECATCYGDMAGCTAHNCPFVCMVGGDACKMCEEGHCRPLIQMCSGQLSNPYPVSNYDVHVDMKRQLWRRYWGGHQGQHLRRSLYHGRSGVRTWRTVCRCNTNENGGLPFGPRRAELGLRHPCQDVGWRRHQLPLRLCRLFRVSRMKAMVRTS